MSTPPPPPKASRSATNLTKRPRQAHPTRAQQHEEHHSLPSQLDRGGPETSVGDERSLSRRRRRSVINSPPLFRLLRPRHISTRDPLFPSLGNNKPRGPQVLTRWRDTHPGALYHPTSQCRSVERSPEPQARLMVVRRPPHLERRNIDRRARTAADAPPPPTSPLPASPHSPHREIRTPGRKGFGLPVEGGVVDNSGAQR